MRISDWISDVCSFDLLAAEIHPVVPGEIERHVLFGDAGLVGLGLHLLQRLLRPLQHVRRADDADLVPHDVVEPRADDVDVARLALERRQRPVDGGLDHALVRPDEVAVRFDPARHDVAGNAAEHRRVGDAVAAQAVRSEEHTSELQSLMRISYAVFCLKTKKPATQQKLYIPDLNVSNTYKNSEPA